MPLPPLILRQTPLKSLKHMSFCARADRDALDENTLGAYTCRVALLGDGELCCSAKRAWKHVLFPYTMYLHSFNAGMACLMREVGSTWM